jgi:hypothetical protein
VFTEPLPRNGLHNPIVPLLVCVLLRNSCFCGSAILAWGKYTTVSYDLKDEHVRKVRRSSGKTDGQGLLLEMLEEVAAVDMIINLQSSG